MNIGPPADSHLGLLAATTPVTSAPAGSKWASRPHAATTRVWSTPVGSTSALRPPAGSTWY